MSRESARPPVLTRREFLRDARARLGGAALGAATLGWGCSHDSPPAGPSDPGDPAGFVPETPYVSEARSGYADPEFSETASRIVFQDPQNRLWIGDLDPVTGLLRSQSGRDDLIDENLPIIIADRQRPNLKYSTNGPEWTRDANGDQVAYTKLDERGVMQQWIARLADGRVERTQLTAGPVDCYGNMPSRFVDGGPARVAFTLGWPITEARAAWVLADRPGDLHTLEGLDPFQMSMWSAFSPEFLFVRRPGPGAGQVAVLDADTGEVRVLTDDGGEKNDPAFFRAPEFGGEQCLVARIDNRALGIYRDPGRPGGAWTRVATLALPASSPHVFLFSTEVIAPATGIDGTSFFTLNASRTNDWGGTGDRAIWVLGLGLDERARFARRIDDGAGSGRLASRMEPEPFLGTREVFVYYSFYDPATGENGLRRARTGLPSPP
jgi:hypothetical protein